MRLGPALLGLLLLAPALGGAGDLESVLSKMEEAERNTQSLRFEFAQTARITATGETQKIRGTAYFRRPDKFRVEHRTPNPQTVVSDGKTLWFYNPSRNQVLVDNWENWARSAGFPQGLTPFQMDVGGMKEKYAVALERKIEDKSGKGAVLKLTPREPGPWPYSLRVRVDLRTGIPVQTELESSSVRTVTEISKTQVNPALADSLFVFRPPSGAEVLGSPFSDKE